MNQKSNFLSSKLGKVLLIVLFFGVLAALNPYQVFRPVHQIIAYVAFPLKKITYSFSSRLANISSFWFSVGQIRSENAELLKENQKLLAENSLLVDAVRENNYLKEQLRLIPKEKFSLEAAYVISRDPYGMGNWVEISKGKNFGIKSGMPVVVSNGIIIGKVGEVQSDSAQIMLITNSQSLVNGLDSETGARGVVRGEYDMGIVMDMILPTESIKAGDRIITAGTSGSIPKGLLVGVVNEVFLSSDGLFQKATISSPIEVAKIPVVFVVKSENPE
jgi:rod shape-determining protein MreC